MSASVVDILHTKKEASLPASIIVEHSAFAARIHQSHSSSRLYIHHPTFPSRRLFCARYPKPKLDRSSSRLISMACLSIGRVEVQERLQVAYWQVFFLMRVRAGTISAGVLPDLSWSKVEGFLTLSRRVLDVQFRRRLHPRIVVDIQAASLLYADHLGRACLPAKKNESIQIESDLCDLVILLWGLGFRV
jgi:hypothetical protein